MFQGCSYRGFGKRIHDRVALRVWMKTVVTQLVFKKTLVVNHCREVIKVDEAMRGSELFHPFVQREDLIGRTTHCLSDRFTIANFIITHRQERREDNTNTMRARE